MGIQRVLMNDIHLGLLSLRKYSQSQKDTPLQSYDIGPESILEILPGLLIKGQLLLGSDYGVWINVSNTMPPTLAIGQSPQRLSKQWFRDRLALPKTNQARHGANGISPGIQSL